MCVVSIFFSSSQTKKPINIFPVLASVVTFRRCCFITIFTSCVDSKQWGQCKKKNCIWNAMFLSVWSGLHFKWNLVSHCSELWFSPSSYTRQEHSETQMLRKRVKDLETEYKQLQLEYQVKESRVVDLESDVEVSFSSVWEWTCKCLVNLKWSLKSSVWSCSCVVVLLFDFFLCVPLCVYKTY